MESYYLPSSIYESPGRLGQRATLNTIIEDDVEEGELQDWQARGRQRTPSPRSSPGASRSPRASLSPTSTISSYYYGSRRSIHLDRRKSVTFREPKPSKDFDDLYDASDDEGGGDDRSTPTRSSKASSEFTDVTSLRSSWSSLPTPTTTTTSRNKYPALVIPSPQHWPSISKQKNSPVPPTPPPKIPITPSALSRLVPMFPPTSAPPSLDGSLSSDQQSISTAPPTPELRSPADHVDGWAQAQLIRVAQSDGSEFGGNRSQTSSPMPDVTITLEEVPPWGTPTSINVSAASSPMISRAESPLLGNCRPDLNAGAGVQLPDDALNILQRLSYDPALDTGGDENQEMLELTTPVKSKSHRSSMDATPASEHSDYSFSQMSIPSPSVFFSSLGKQSRHTWCAFKSEPSSAHCPSSTTAERFYNAPWNRPPENITRQVIEVDDDGSTEGPPTARQIPPTKPPDGDSAGDVGRTSADIEDSVREIDRRKLGKDYDEQYEQELWLHGEATIDRTSDWLSAQSTYLEILKGTHPHSRSSSCTLSISRRASRHIREDSLDSPMKRAVKFLDTAIAKAKELGTPSPKSAAAEPIFYKAFQHVSNTSSPTDSFIHRHSRYDALQTFRNSLRKSHLDALLGHYSIATNNRPEPHRPISLMPGKGQEEETAEQRVIAQVEQEQQALDQITTVTWIVEALRFFNGGRLLNSPAGDLLLHAPPAELCCRPDQVRVLDLGGQPQCDWAWHCAREYRNVRTYTATPNPIAELSNIRGPPNHRITPVTNFWTIPFPDNHFDAISARTLHAFLKHGGMADEYDKCLKECVRILKPGGYLEFFILDSEILQAGPLGTALSVEFSFNLKSRGYDPSPTKAFLSRLRHAGLVDIKRAWMFLPMGVSHGPKSLTPETPDPRASLYEDDIKNVEPVQGPVGSVADVAEVSGLVGSWLWEQWMVKLQTELGRPRESLLEQVGKAIEEGRGIGAGWRCLSGWARKAF